MFEGSIASGLCVLLTRLIPNAHFRHCGEACARCVFFKTVIRRFFIFVHATMNTNRTVPHDFLHVLFSVCCQHGKEQGKSAPNEEARQLLNYR